MQRNIHITSCEKNCASKLCTQNDVNFDKIRNEQVALPGECKLKWLY